MTGVERTKIAGLEETTALSVVGESGLDRHRWPSAQPFTSWLGWCPRVRVSGGRVLSSRTRPTANRAAAAWRLAAASRHHAQSALGAFFRRIAARRGVAKAITATAYKLARIVYAMLKHGMAYVAQGLEAYEMAYQERVVRQVKRKAAALGLVVGERDAGAQPS